MDARSRLAALGTGVPEVLIPREGVDLQKWAVIACDQFTQDREFWEAAREGVGNSPSTLNLIFPEIYLDLPDRQGRIKKIQDTMGEYLEGGVFRPGLSCCVYLERSTPYNPLRRGLLAAIDLEAYDYDPKSEALIRSTEGTVKDRLPPRMDIRRHAKLELPHILILIDDDEDRLLPHIAEQVKGRGKLYETDLMAQAGHVSAWALEEEDDLAFLAGGLEDLAERSKSRYGGSSGKPFLYAMGDGNHSLATAKEIWEEHKKLNPQDTGKEHPLRYAMAEIENLYDPGITFEPIHRILFGIGGRELLPLLGGLPGCRSRTIAHEAELIALVGDRKAGVNRLGLATGEDYILVETDAPGLLTGSLQPILDDLLEERKASANPLSIDYIHGSGELLHLSRGAERPAAALLLPPIQKAGLFDTVARGGPLPRKSFSMGEGIEKRFYLECRRIG